MNFKNFYRIYLALTEKHNPERRLVRMTEGIKEATHGLLQRGEKIRTRAQDHPSPVKDMKSVYNTGCGKRKRLDAKGVITTTRVPPVEDVSSGL